MKKLILLTATLLSTVPLPSAAAPAAVANTATSRRTEFDPAVHGFAFVNSFETTPFSAPGLSEIRFGGLCGGMSYAALDHFLASRPAPRGADRPATGTPLFNYIYSRQENSFIPNADKWIELGFNPLGARNSEFYHWGIQTTGGGRIQELRECIDAGKPAPIGLFVPGGGGIKPHHQVLAIAYEMGRYRGNPAQFANEVRIHVYDPNYPGQIKVLTPKPESQIYRYTDSAETYMTYFVDRRYRHRVPPTFPAARPVSPGMVQQLKIEIHTANDDLRGGSDNVDFILRFRTLPDFVKRNLNNSARWIDNYSQTVVVELPRPVAISELKEAALQTHFGGGFGSDEWKISSMKVCAVVDGSEQVLGQRSSTRGGLIHHFKSDRHTFTLGFTR